MERRWPLGVCKMISTADSRVPKRSAALPTTAPATAPSTPTTTASREPPTDEPATPPATAPAALPMPLCEPSTTTGRTDNTTASSTLERRWASPGWITSGLVVVQALSAVRAAVTERAASRREGAWSLNIRARPYQETTPRLYPRGSSGIIQPQLLDLARDGIAADAQFLRRLDAATPREFQRGRDQARFKQPGQRIP